MTSARRDELATALHVLRARIEAACVSAGRMPEEVALLTVTKSVTAEDVALLCDLGLIAFGENRVTDAVTKADRLRELRPAVGARWHLVGRLQRNKVRALAPWVARVESVDSERLATALDDAVGRAVSAGKRRDRLPVLIQLSVDGDPDRGGITADRLQALAGHVAGCGGLVLAGVMAVAPLGWDPDRAFVDVASAAAELRREHPAAEVVSIGMSGDLEAAIRQGSTCVRVGTALLSGRPLASS